jgi:hypothetical protein
MLARQATTPSVLLSKLVGHASILARRCLRANAGQCRFGVNPVERMRRRVR